MLFNKILGSVLAVLLAILGIKEVSNMAFGKAAHHGHHGEEEHSMNERLASAFAYYLPVEEDAHGAAAEEEEVFDLGALLASADIEKGAKSFRSKCSSCHTVDDGGSNGTGPNLHDVVGRPIASHEGFGYSAPMQQHAADYPAWSYEALNEFLTDPKGAVPGTAMSFAGLRKDPERMDVIAYLASVNPAAPSFPAPLPEAGDVAEEAADEASDLVEGSLEAVTEGTDAAGDVVEAAIATGEEAAGEATDLVGDLVEEATEVAEDAEEAVHDMAEEHGVHH